MKQITLFVLACLALLSAAQSSVARDDGKSAPKSISEYLKGDKLITVRHAFYNADKSQRVEYYCDDENMPGGANEGASNPANVHCAAALFLHQSDTWMFSDEIELRYGSVKTFVGHKLVAELMEYGDSDPLCCPSEKTVLVFNTESGKLIEDIAAEGKPNLVQAIENDADANRVADMISRGTDVNAQDAKGHTPLIIAVERHKADIAQLLLDHKGNVNAIQKDGNSALISATLSGNAIIVRLLLEKGADVNAAKRDGTTSLIYAAISGSTDLTRQLLEKGAKINTKNKNGCSALTYAVSGNRADVVRLLLERGAKVNEKDDNDLTPLILAIFEGNLEIVRLLLDNGADVNTLAAEGRTALMFASRGGHAAIVKLLLEHGADRNLKSLNGETALDFAKGNGNQEIVVLLKDDKVK